MATDDEEVSNWLAILQDEGILLIQNATLQEARNIYHDRSKALPGTKEYFAKVLTTYHY